MKRQSRTLAEITVVGPDRKGIVAAVTNTIFQNRGNIEKINQNVISSLFGMHLEASFQRERLNEDLFRDGLISLGRNFGMEVKVHFDEPDRVKNMALLVSKEEHCLQLILEAQKKKEIRVKIPLIVATDKTLNSIAKKFGIPFFFVEHKDQSKAQIKILQLLERFNVDFVVLARYMRILTPNFVWRYPNRIINVHPSLLPAFPGAYAYRQAYEKGAQIVGCTAHFVTDELDEGPILWQDSFRVDWGEEVESIRKKGQEQEARTLLNGIKLFLEKKLEVYWGKVHLSN